MNAIIVSIGDELVLGQTVDTNSAWLAQRLATVGMPVAAHITVADDQAAIEQAIREAVERCDVLLVSGGLGPTADDLTRQALAAVMGVPLEMNEACLERLRAFFAGRGRPMPEANLIQAMIPRGAAMIENTAGTAAGIQVLLARADCTPVQAGVDDASADDSAAGGGVCRVFIMPGVPKEMKIMFDHDVAPRLSRRGGGAVILSRTLHTFGLGESNVAELLGDLMQRSRNPSVGTTVAQGIVSLRINARFDSQAEAERELAATEAECRSRLGALIYGADGQPLAAVLGEMLRARGATVAVAESCTGGLLAAYLTDIAGSSACFRYGWITYADEAKTTQLGVEAQVLAEHGAVSEPTVARMAEGARLRSGADYALSISGIAGPDGGTAAKPVGTVCIGLASAGATITRTFRMSGDREMIRDRSAKMAMTLLRYHLLDEPMPC